MSEPCLLDWDIVCCCRCVMPKSWRKVLSNTRSRWWSWWFLYWSFTSMMISFYALATLHSIRHHQSTVHCTTFCLVNLCMQLKIMDLWSQSWKKRGSQVLMMFWYFLNWLTCAGGSRWVHAPAAGVCTGSRPRVPHPDVALHVWRSNQVHWYWARLGRPVGDHALFRQGKCFYFSVAY